MQTYVIFALIATNIGLALALYMMPKRRKMPPIQIAEDLEEMASIKTSVLYSKRKTLRDAAEKIRDQASDIQTLKMELAKTHAWYAGMPSMHPTLKGRV